MKDCCFCESKKEKYHISPYEHTLEGMELELPYFTNVEFYVIVSMAFPPNILSLLPKQCLPYCLCAAVAHGSVSPTHCTGVSPFLSSCTTTKREHHANICLLPVFLSKNTVTTTFSASLQNRYPWDDLPAASQQAPCVLCALLSQPAAQTSCFPSCVTPGWNRGKCEYSIYKPNSRARKALDNSQF